MKKFSVFMTFSIFCSVCFGAPSMRASSVPLTHQNSLNSPKTPVTTVGAKADSAQTSDSVSTNESRIAFISPLAKNNQKYHYNTPTYNNPAYQASANTANTAKEMAEMQRQIDELLDKQTDIENSLLPTVQQAINSSNLNDNQSFSEAVSDLQNKTANIENLNATVETKIDTKLVEKGIVDNDGELQVAKKAEITPEVIAEKIIRSEDAKEILSGQVGTDETEVKRLILSDLQDRGIVDTANPNKLNVATTETVNDLASKAITTDNFEEKLDEQNVITSDNVETALSDAGVAKQEDLQNLATSSVVEGLRNDLETATAGVEQSGSILNTIYVNKESLGLKGDKGLDGETFTPSIDNDGILSWKKKDGSDSGIAAVKVKGEKGLDGETFTPSVNDEGMLSWKKKDGSDSGIAAVKVKGEKGLDGETFTPSVNDEGMLSWKKKDGSDSGIAAVKVKGEKGLDGETFTPSIDNDGILSWKKKDGSDSGITAVKIKGDKGDAGNAGADGETFTPSIDNDGILSWKKKDGSDSGIAAFKIKGDKGDKGDAGNAGADGETFTPSIDNDGILSWKKKDGSDSGIAAFKIKGDKGDKGDAGDAGTNGETFTPFIADGMLSWKKKDGTDSGITAVKIVGDKGDKGDKGDAGTGINYRGEIDNFSALSAKERINGDAWYNQDDGLLYICTIPTGGTECSYPINGKGSRFRGQDGETFTPLITDGMLSWRKHDGSDAGFTAVKVVGDKGDKGDDGETFTPFIADGMLSWKKNGIDSGITPVKVVGDKGDKGDDGETFTPFIADGMLSWKKNGIDSGITPVKVVGDKGDKGDDGETFTPLITDGMLSWRKADGSDSGIVAVKIKGDKGDAGTGINYRGEIDNFSALSAKERINGDAWYNQDDGLLYICTIPAGGTECSYPISGKGSRFRGQDGETFTPLITDGMLSWRKKDGSDAGITAVKVVGDKGDKGDDGETFTPLITDGMLSWKKHDGSDAGFTAVKVVGDKGDKGDDGETFTPFIADGMLSWKKNGIDSGITPVKVVGDKGDKGDDGETFTPFIADGMLSWKKNGIDSGITPVKVVGDKGDKGDDGETFTPFIADGMLSWTKNGIDSGITPVKVVGDKGNDGETFTPLITNGMLSWTKNGIDSGITPVKVVGDKGNDGKTYVPVLSSVGDLTWNLDGQDSGIASINLKGPKGNDGNNGVTFTPAFNSTTGELSWTSSDSNVAAPSAMKVAQTSSELNGLIVSGLQAQGLLSTGDNPTRLFMTSGDLDDEFSSRNVITTGNLSDNGIITTGNLTNNGIVTTTTLEGSLPADIVRSNNLPSNIITTGNLTTNGIVTTTTLEGSLPADIVRSNNLPSNIITTGNLTNNGIVTTTTLEGSLPADIVRSNNLPSNIITTTTLGGALNDNNVVTSGNFAAKLQSNLSNTNVQNALSAAGYKTADDVNSTVVTMADLSRLLSGGLVVDRDTGKVQLDQTSSKATSIMSKLTSAKQKDSAVITTGVSTNTNIVTSVANATAAASGTMDETTCNQTAYMFWNPGKAACETCPEGTHFNKTGTGTARCVCDDENLMFAESGGKYICVEVNDPGVCNQNDFTYWSNGCHTCPANTHFERDSETRCICDDESQQFNTQSGQCVPLGQNQCVANKMYWNPKSSACMECPAEVAPFSEEHQTCVCQEDGFVFSTTDKGCKECPEGSDYNPEQKTCVCGEGTFNVSSWECIK